MSSVGSFLITHCTETEGFAYEHGQKDALRTDSTIMRPNSFLKSVNQFLKAN